MTMLPPSISHNLCSHDLLAPPFGAGSVWGHYAGKSSWRERLTLADSVPSLHCGSPADFLTCFCAVDSVLTCFSLSVNVLHYRLHFLPYCVEEEKRLGFLLRILSFYTCILEWRDSEPDGQNCRSAVKGF